MNKLVLLSFFGRVSGRLDVLRPRNPLQHFFNALFWRVKNRTSGPNDAREEISRLVQRSSVIENSGGATESAR